MKKPLGLYGNPAQHRVGDSLPVHSPNFAKKVGPFQTVQLLVSLPDKKKRAAPSYQSIRDADIPSVALLGDAGRSGFNWKAPDRDSNMYDSDTEFAHSNRLRMIGQLAASLAHEVRQPLAALAMDLQTASRWIETESPRADGCRRAIARAVANSDRVAALVIRISR